MATLTTTDADIANLIRYATLRVYMYAVEWHRQCPPGNDRVEEAHLRGAEERVLREMRLGGWIAEEESKEVCNGACTQG